MELNDALWKILQNSNYSISLNGIFAFLAIFEHNMAALNETSALKIKVFLRLNYNAPAKRTKDEHIRGLSLDVLLMIL